MIYSPHVAAYSAQEEVEWQVLISSSKHSKQEFIHWSNETALRSKTVSPLSCVVMHGALGAPDSVDAAVHHAHPDPVPGGVEGCSLAPLVGHGVVAAQQAGFGVGLEGQIPASNL